MNTEQSFDDATGQNDLNDALTSLPIYACKICKHFLLPPIRLVKDTGHVCGICNIPDGTVAIHDTALETILWNLIFPCPNSAKGCEKRLVYDDVATHILECLSRDYQCPFNFVTDCIWKGGMSDILEHANFQHPKGVIRARNGKFPLKINISNSSNTIKILQMNEEQFILHINCDLSHDTLYYFLYYMGSKEKAQSYNYSVQQTNKIGHNYFSLQDNSIYKVLHDVEFKLDCDKYSAVSVDLSLIKRITQGASVVAVVKIFTENKRFDSKYLDAELLNFLECPICVNWMRPPIWQCLLGHSICDSCRWKVPQCPLCHTTFGETRNYSLESLSAVFKFPCVNQHLGCETLLPLQDLKKHEAKCKAKRDVNQNKSC